MPNLAATETSGAASRRTRATSLALFFLIIACGIVYVGVHLSADLGPVKESSVLPFLLLIVALLIALGFEFVSGFHDTENAVATVIYTHSVDQGRRLRVAGVDDARARVRRGRHDDRERRGAAPGHGAQPRARVGADVARVDRAVGRPVLGTARAALSRVG